MAGSMRPPGYCLPLAWLLLLLPPPFSHSSHTTLRLENICPPKIQKVRVRLRDTPFSLHLNSSLLPGSQFSCHIEFTLTKPHFGFFLHINSLDLVGEGPTGLCVSDYLQFGRDILFITSHRSERFCGRLNKEYSEERSLASRNYIESRDQEMDLWIKLAVASSHSVVHKAISLTVTPFRKTCTTRSRLYRHCSIHSPYCVRKSLFCDGQVNCPGQLDSPAPDEDTCLPQPQPTLGQDLPLPLSAPLLLPFSLVLLTILPCFLCSIHTYIRRGKERHGGARRILSAQESFSMEVEEEYDHGRVINVPPPPEYTRNRRRAPPLSQLPLSYSETIELDVSDEDGSGEVDFCPVSAATRSNTFSNAGHMEGLCVKKIFRD